MRDADDVFDEYMNTHFTRMEGQRGYDNLEELVKAIGYGNSTFMMNRAIEDFFLDNPGAIEAVVEWIGEQVSRNSDWSEKLEELLPEEEPEEEDEDDTLSPFNTVNS